MANGYARYNGLSGSGGGGGSGTVTSVGLADGSSTPIYSISGSPVTTAGTLTFTLNTESANTVFSGPTTGVAAQPTFRALVAADIPSLSGLYLPLAGGTLTGQLNIAVASTSPLTINTNSFIFDSTNNALGIGVTPSTNSFIDAVNSSGAAKRIVLTGYGVGSTVGTRGRFARGTSGTPAAAQSGDVLNFWSGQGYGTSQFPTASTAAINAVAGETFTNSSNLTYLSFQTTPTASVTVAESARIASTGVTLGPQASSTAVHAINGGMLQTVKSVNANYTVDTTTSDLLLLVDSSGGAITITLPAHVAGRIVKVKDSTGSFGTNNVTLARAGGSGSIEGLAASLILSANWGNYELRSNGTNWYKTSAASNFATVLFSGSTTWVAPAGITQVLCSGRGGSGGGGGGGSGGGGSTATRGGGSGGGAGGASTLTRSRYITVVPGTTYTITIGSGGTAGAGGAVAALNAAGSAGNNGTTGGNGGNSTFGSLAQFRGGTNGGAGSANATFSSAGTGGAAATTTENVNIAGGAGGSAGNNGTAAANGSLSFFGNRTNGGTGGASGGNGGGGGGGSGCSGGDADGNPANNAGNGGNGGSGTNGGSGVAASTQTGAGCGGLGGGGGGGGDTVAVTGSQGGVGGNGSAGNTGYISIVWGE